MRYTAEHKKKTRDRILRAASRQVRGRGEKGVAIAELMAELDLTHGGFYRHFASKQQLLVEAVAKGFEEVAAKQARAVAKGQPGGELRSIIELYLSPEHCANPADGCPLAALTSEIARYPQSLRVKIDRAMREHLKPLVRFLPGETEAEREHNCLILFSGMAGALNMARSMADRERRQAMLEAAKDFYIKAFCA